jgi:hypothetical protein
MSHFGSPVQNFHIYTNNFEVMDLKKCTSLIQVSELNESLIK